MFSATVELPVWIVVVTLVLAALAFFDRLLMPSVRWALRRRANRAIEELNSRLKLQIRPFKLTKRQVLIDSLIYDPEVLHAVEDYAKQAGIPNEVAMEKVQRYAREIVPSFSAYTYFRVGTRLAKRVSRILYRVRVGYRSDEALAKVDPDASVVFVINHRSNMDYVLVTYVAASSSALSYAVGEWAQIWGLRGLIRSMGAYFIRRDSRDVLYRKVLARYVQMATNAGVVQAIFPEGGLSRDGRLRPPKFGLLSYMVSGFDVHGQKDVVFIPVGINYDRVLEDRMLTAEAAAERGEKPDFRFNVFVLMKHVAKHLWLAVRGGWHRFGYACVSFGEPVSLRGYLAERDADLRIMSPDERHDEMERLGHRLMEAVGRVVPALPVSLVATALLRAGDEPLPLSELKARVMALIEELEDSGTYVHIPRADREYAVDAGLQTLRLRHLVRVEESGYRIEPKERLLLTYYANAIAHLLPPVAKATPVLSEPLVPAK